MFASKRRKRMFVSCMAISWLGLLLQWFSFDPLMEGYVWGFYFSLYVVLHAVIVFALCFNEPTKKPNK